MIAIAAGSKTSTRRDNRAWPLSNASLKRPGLPRLSWSLSSSLSRISGMTRTSWPESRRGRAILGWAVVAQVAYFLATIVTWQKAFLYATGRTVALRESLSQILMVNFGKYIPGKIWGMAARGKRLTESGFGVEEIARQATSSRFSCS